MGGHFWHWASFASMPIKCRTPHINNVSEHARFLCYTPRNAPQLLSIKGIASDCVEVIMVAKIMIDLYIYK